jgi:ribokinase
VVDAMGENVITVIPGANSAFTALLPAERDAVAAADVLLTQLETPISAVTEAARVARAAGTRVVLNAAPARDLPPDLLDAVDLLVVNEGEAGALKERHELLDLVPRAVVTLGAAGAWYMDRDGTSVRVPAFAVSTVDSTAAGDAFTGAVAVAWAEGRDLVDAVRWACAAGAACVRTMGASSSLPTRAQIDEIYAHRD